MLPHLDPNLVLWCNVASDVVTTLASSLAAWATLKLYAKKLRAEALALAGKVEK